MTRSNASTSTPCTQEPEPVVGNDWRVTLELRAQGLSTAIQGFEGGAAWEYAFYLMRGRERVETRWYTDEPHAVFSHRRSTGRYHVVGFIRHAATGQGQTRTSGEVSLAGGGYDPQRWHLPLHDHASLDAFCARRTFADGIHRIGHGNGRSLDLLMSGLQAPRSGAVLLVGFSAAQRRHDIAAPIFSGLTLARSLGLPLIAVADPLVSANDSLALAWYAGGEDWQGLPQRIAAALDHVAQALNLPLLLFGGSGGGFAALCVQQHLQTRADACIWNPQTSISRYHLPLVAAYARRALPRALGAARQLTAPQIAQAFEAAGMQHDLTRVTLVGDRRLVLLQSESDRFHVDNHLVPFSQAHGVSLAATGVTAWDGGSRCIGIGHWGRGHAKLPTALACDLLRGMVQGVPLGPLVQASLSRHATQSAHAAPVDHRSAGRQSRHINTP